MSTVDYAQPVSSARGAALFGQVMGLVARTVATATLGVYVARGAGGALWFLFWLAALGCLVALNVANRNGSHGLALALLLAFGFLVGASVSSTVNYYARTDPTAVRQAFGATALFVGGLGAGGYAVRRDLSFLYRLLFWLLIGLIAASIVLIFVRMQAAYVVWSLFGLAIFGGYTVVDFNRLRHAGGDEAIPLAAGIFLDILNVFLLFLRLFASSR